MTYRINAEIDQVGAAKDLNGDEGWFGVLQDRAKPHRHCDRKSEGAQDVAQDGGHRSGTPPSNGAGNDKEDAWSGRQNDDHGRNNVLPNTSGNNNGHLTILLRDGRSVDARDLVSVISSPLGKCMEDSITDDRHQSGIDDAIEGVVAMGPGEIGDPDDYG